MWCTVRALRRSNQPLSSDTSHPPMRPLALEIAEAPGRGHSESAVQLKARIFRTGKDTWPKLIERFVDFASAASPNCNRRALNSHKCVSKREIWTAGNKLSETPAKWFGCVSKFNSGTGTQDYPISAWPLVSQRGAKWQSHQQPASVVPIKKPVPGNRPWQTSKPV